MRNARTLEGEGVSNGLRR